MKQQFKALLIKEEGGNYVPSIAALSLNDLAKGDLLVKVEYSSVNYKDALSSIGNKGVTRFYPHVPGIDAVGTVVQSASPKFAVGSRVLLTGFDLGMNIWGGFGQYVSVPYEWAIMLPNTLLAKDAMSFGTAGLTAGLSVYQLLKAGIQPMDGKIAVSGASGGVGSIATAILSKLGYAVVAISGKQDDDFLIHTLGAEQVISRQQFVEDNKKRALGKPVFGAGIDTVGGDVLSAMLKTTLYGGIIACCGMVASTDLNTSIFPFIIRGVQLNGIDSVEAPMAIREIIWEKLAQEWRPIYLEKMVQEILLADLPQVLDSMLKGTSKGRFVLKHTD